MLSDCCRTDESNLKISPHNSKEAPDSALSDRFARGSSVPISIKYKKMATEEAISRQEHRRDRCQLELGKSMREPPPIEIGPKRHKVRGPSSYLGTEQVGLKFRSLE